MPTGTIRLKWQYFTETFTIGSATLNNGGVATLTRSNLNADTYPLTAVYLGDAANLACIIHERLSGLRCFLKTGS
jgi:hypothetical protein